MSVLNELETHFTTRVVNQNEEKVMKTMMKDFHKKPIQTRLNELSQFMPTLDINML